MLLQLVILLESLPPNTMVLMALITLTLSVLAELTLRPHLLIPLNSQLKLILPLLTSLPLLTCREEVLLKKINIPAAPGVPNDYYVVFTAFSGNADFTRVGSVSLSIQALNDVDTFVNLFALAGPDSTPPPPPAVSASPSPIPGDTWYRFDDDDDGKSPCGEEADENTVFLADNNIIYYYFYGFQRPYIYVSNPNNGAALLIPSIFACILALFAL